MRDKHIHAAAVLIIEDGKILSVSCKDNHSDMGLPGGKLNLHESHVSAAHRETYDKTGYNVLLDLDTPPYHGAYDGYSVITFLAKRLNTTPDETSLEETGLVEFISPQELLKGSFAPYYTEVFEWFKIGETL